MDEKVRVITIPVINEEELVQHFARCFRGRVVYHEDQGIILVWNGKYFVQLESEVYRWAKRLIRSLNALFRIAKKRVLYPNWIVVDKNGDPVNLKDLEDFIKNLKRFGTPKKIIENGKFEPGILRRGDILDQDHRLLCVENGLIDLFTGQLLPHSKGALCTKICPTAYDPDAKCELWERVIHDVTCGDIDVAWHIQKLLGYGITGYTGEQILVIFYGLGENGKSLVLKTVQNVLGPFSLSTPTATFLRRSASVIPNDVARLADARFVIGQELNAKDVLNESLIKQLTGQDKVAARFLFREYFEFTPKFKLFIAANNLPTIVGADNGIARRLKIVPFLARFSGKDRDNDLAEKLKAEYPGILNWLVKGAMAYFKEGLEEPTAVANATRDFLDEENFVRRFMRERCLVAKGKKTGLGTMYEEFCDWAKDQPIEKIGKKQFGSRLKELGFEQNPGGSPRTWKDLTIQPNP